MDQAQKNLSMYDECVTFIVKYIKHAFQKGQVELSCICSFVEKWFTVNVPN